MQGISAVADLKSWQIGGETNNYERQQVDGDPKCFPTDEAMQKEADFVFDFIALQRGGEHKSVPNSNGGQDPRAQDGERTAQTNSGAAQNVERFVNRRHIGQIFSERTEGLISPPVIHDRIDERTGTYFGC